MSPNAVGFLIQWPLTAVLAWVFKSQFDWPWAISGLAGVFGAMLITFITVQILFARGRKE